VLRLDSLTVETLGQSEDHLLLIALTDDGQAVDPRGHGETPDHPGYTSGPDRPDGRSDAEETRRSMNEKLDELSHAREAEVRRNHL